MTQPQVHPTDAVLGDFQLGKLPDPEHADIESHLTECSDCQGRVAAIRIDDSLIGLLAGCAAPNPGLDSAATPPAAAETQGWDKAAATVTGDEAMPNSLAGHAKYQAVRRLGVGGMGTVWLAQHALMNRPVAVKVIRPELLARAGATIRFLREVRVAAKLHHPNIVTAFDAEPVGTSCLLVMEYVDGETLADLVKAGPLPVIEACLAAQDAARGLAHAHAAGLVHRDVKPHNLIRAADGTTKVLDFGLAGVGVGELAAAGEDNVTGAGMVFGTPDYIAPEQADDPHGADARADVYGLGCTLYHLLSGRPPFPDESILQMINAHHLRQPEPIPNLPPRLAAVLARMMAKKVEDRFQTATDVADALQPFTGKAKSKARRRWLVAALLLALVGLLAAAGVVYTIQRGKEEIAIATDNPDIEVVMQRNGELLRIRDTKTGQVWELDTVKNQLGLVDDPNGLTVSLPEKEPIILRRKGEKVFTVTRLPAREVEEKVGEVRKFEGHKGSVRAVAYSPCGRFALSGSGWPHSDRTLRLWDVATGKEIWCRVADKTKFASVVFSPNGLVAASGGDPDGMCRLWQVETGKELHALQHGMGAVFAVAFTPDGNRVLTGGEDGWLRLWDLKTGQQLKSYQDRPGRVLGVAVSPDGRQAVSVGEGSLVRSWDLEKGVELRRFQGHDGNVPAVAFDPRGRNIVTGGDDRTVRVWDAKTGKQIRCLEGHERQVYSVAFSPDGRRVLSGGWDKVLNLWDVESGQRIQAFAGHADVIWGVAFSPKGEYALSCSGGNLVDGRMERGIDWTVRLWRLPNPSDQPRPPRVRSFAPAPEKSGVVQALRSGTWVELSQVAPDGRTILVSSGDEVYLYETATSRTIQRPVGASAVYADGGRKIVTIVNEGTGNRFRVYDVATGQLERTFGRLAGRTWDLYSLACGNQVLTWDSTRTVKLFDVKSGSEILSWKYEDENVDFTFTPDGRRLLFRPVGEARYSVCDPATGDRTDEFAALRGLAHLRSFSADGKTVQDGLGWDEKTAMIHRVLDGKVVGRPQGVPADARRHGTSPDRTKQLFLLPDGTLQLRDAVTWKLLNSVRIDLPGDYKRFRAPHNQAMTDDGRFAILNTRDQDGHVIVIRFPDPPKP